MSAVAIALAGAAGLCNAVGDLLERSSAQHEESEPRNSVRLVGRLARQPRWLAGVLVSLVGLALHIGALSQGGLAVVQPMLVIELPLAVIGAAVFLGRRPAPRDWVAVAMMTAGLAAFLYFLAPTGGDRMSVPGPVWAAAVGAVLLAVAALAVAGWRARQDLRAALLATASGAGYGLTGVFFSTAAHALGTGGIAAAAGAWQTWASVVTGVTSFWLLQNALAAGRLVAVEPGITLTNPVVAVLWGLLVFGETARGGAALLGTGAGAALVVAGVVVLGGSPALQSRPPDAARGTRGPMKGAAAPGAVEGAR